MRKLTWRAYLIFFVLIASLFVLFWRLIELSFMDRHFLLQQSDARILRVVTIPAHRGMITDRTGAVLALSSPMYSAWINPHDFHPTFSQLHALATDLQLSSPWIEKQTEKFSKKSFVYLKRQNTPDVKEKIDALKIPGVHFEIQYQRFYPEGEVTAHVLGMTNVDDQGQEGLELAYNTWLGGTNGKNEVLKDRLGHVIADVALLKQPKPGRDLMLSMDHRIQYLAYRALKEQVQQMGAKSGSIVVLNPKTGEILAMANQPSYNPNGRITEENGDFRNRAVTDSFEPGSTMKPFTIALALESGQYKPTSLVDTHPGYMHIGGYDIRDDFRDNGIINLQRILQVSSNVGAAKILLSLSPDKFWTLLSKMGFGDRTSSGFPGESAGRFLSHPVWYSSDVATLAYGYGIAVTALQLARAYAILACDGIRKPISFLKLDSVPAGHRVMGKKVANEVVEMLETVIQKGGTGTLAAVPGYHVAGKTGTAYIAGANGYDKKKYVASFVGMAPVNDPQLVIAVVIRDPQVKHFGGAVSAPVFSTVMAGALRILNVAPDDLKT
ncbi:MAG: cell division protein [Gammaproteobacteria bacterium RIFCSPLOWO2_02_FULL_42_14]|nr:MAG: cell division protein [Gammaproteobacteria bacterium RIFCSPHIGHO2_02_FULL_42_43]OGT29265.1 MAG: cell division protein [Gammaproteobacteria bacterium RIFCSPHIGHO2_01_FULL_42_8]OGT50876.1 MAG: cell division protein [Gammaproteobacteria bacterium RIFCSPHIGHO2_12_FULL_41_25]OGT62529.1 MAG: cell division protein [Gammaproteobacteria bacterium RIFCSPLOWO2_02_FULL_42_14]OGT86513.1 MAG: cell division protein [Gammaproteobacteria bacterium RIFCSPLOWO2_12_FULL_42_18]